MRARSTWILTLAVGLASCAIAAACTSRSGTTFAPPDAGYEISEGGSFGSADTGPPQRAQCGCDGGALEIRVSGDGADQILTHSNPATGCTSDVPTGYFFTCGGADWYTEQIAACGASAADAPCILFDRQPTPAGYVDREGGVWDLGGTAIDLDDGGALPGVMSGVFAVKATRVGCEDAGCAVDLIGSFRVCATGEDVAGCE